MKIKIDSARITTALSDAELGATARTLSADDVRAAVEAAEVQLSALGLRKKDWPGATVHVANPFELPNSYKWPASYTLAKVQRFASGWFLINATRVHGNSSKGSRLILTPEQRDRLPLDWHIG